MRIDQDEAGSIPSNGRLRRTLLVVGPLSALAIFAIALAALHGMLGPVRYHEIMAELERIPRERVLAAIGLTLLAQLLAPLYDLLALRHLGVVLPARRIAFAGFVGSALSNGLGFPLLTGEALRYRLYAGWGISAIRVGAMLVLNGAGLALGGLVLGGILLLREGMPLVGASWASLPLAGTALLLVGGYLSFGALARSNGQPRALRVRGIELELPGLSITLGQLGLSLLQWSLAAGAAFVLIPSPLPAAPFVLVFVLAQAAGLLSHVPQGLVVFEATTLYLLDARAEVPGLLAGLLAFRVVYYLLPLALGLLLVFAGEMRRLRVGEKAGEAWQRWAAPLLPQVFAGMAYLGGLVLLASGATPAMATRLHWLEKLVPLGVIETLHLFGSLTGVLLLFLARALQRRIDTAYIVTLSLLAVGSLASLGKGGDYEEASILAAMLLLLLPCRRLFTRRGSLLNAPFTASWFLAIGVAIAGTTWLGLFAYKHVPYSDDLFWQFSLNGDAPRFLRALVGVSVLTVILAAASLLSPRPAPFHVASEEDLERVRAIARGARESYAQLALTGDKAILFSESGRSFLMYGIAGRSWVCFRDPVGDPAERAELCWRFRELADRAGGWTVFQEVSAASLPLYLDLGLALLKAGEEARVPLADFSLDGSARASIRHSHRRAERDGLSFRVIEREEVPALMPSLREVSDSWLAQKETREKRFSLGFFEPRYLAECPIGLIEREGRVVGFANLWLSGEDEEISIDLMRFQPDAGGSVMDFLFAELMLWGRARGFRWFNLGLAPLSGVEPHAFAPAWNRVAALLFRHGELFYNFEGLRSYKAKFDPVWEPRYFAVPGGLATPRILGDVASLTSGGWRGLIGK